MNVSLEPIDLTVYNSSIILVKLKLFVIVYLDRIFLLDLQFNGRDREVNAF